MKKRINNCAVCGSLGATSPSGISCCSNKDCTFRWIAFPVNQWNPHNALIRAALTTCCVDNKQTSPITCKACIGRHAYCKAVRAFDKAFGVKTGTRGSASKALRDAVRRNREVMEEARKGYFPLGRIFIVDMKGGK